MTNGNLKQAVERSVKLCIGNDGADIITGSTYIFVSFFEMKISQNV
jgi:hypothetical protein